MNTLDAQALTDAAISALERTAMVLAEPVQEGEPRLAPATRYARIAYSGPQRGAIILGANDQFLRSLASGMIGVGLDEVTIDGHGIDALKEMANIVGGSVLLTMSQDASDLSLGLPEIVTKAQVEELAARGAGSTVGCAIAADDGVLRAMWMRENAAKAA